MDKIKTGNLIRDARNRKGYTQSELGALIGVTNKAISRWENGEAFPDVGVLEELSNVLELEIRDIVVGEKDDVSTDALTEMARAVKIQEKEKQRKNLKSVILFMVMAFFVFAGIGVFKGDISLSANIFYIFTALAVCFITAFLVGGTNSDRHHEDKKGKWIIGVSIASGIYGFGAVFAALLLALNNMAPARIGIIANVQLFIVFLINALFLLYCCYNFLANGKTIRYKVLPMLFAMFLTVDYSDFLHSINSFDNVLLYFAKRTGIILGVIVVSFFAVLFCKKRFNNINNHKNSD